MKTVPPEPETSASADPLSNITTGLLTEDANGSEDAEPETGTSLR